jgi:hypothetical protein
VYRILVGKLESVHLEDQEGDGRITLRLMVGRWVVRIRGGWLKTMSNNGFDITQF